MFSVSLCLLVPFRFVQLILWTEADTGFLTDGLLSKSILFGGLLLALLLLILMSAKCKNFPESYRPVKNFSVTVAAVLAGAAIILKSIYEIYEVAVLGVHGVSGTFTDGHPAFSVALSVLGLVAAMMFFVIAGNFGSGSNTFQALPILALLIPLWHCYNLIIQFVSTVSGASVAENALEVLTLVFALLFLFFQAELLAGMDPARAVRRCFLFGFPAVLFAMLSSLPVCVMYALQMPVASSFSMFLHLANLCIALYIFAFLIALTRNVDTGAEAPVLDPAFGYSDGLPENAAERAVSPEPQPDSLLEKAAPSVPAEFQNQRDVKPAEEAPRPKVPAAEPVPPESVPQPEPIPAKIQPERSQPKPVPSEPEVRTSVQNQQSQTENPEIPVQEKPEADARRARIDRLYETLMQERREARSQEKKL